MQDESRPKAINDTTMNQDTAARFDREFAPRIAAVIAGLFKQHVRVEVVPYAGAGHPTRVTLTGARLVSPHGYVHPLNVSLTWDSDAINGLMQPDGEARFVRYLTAIPRKMQNWEGGRPIDFGSRAQAEPSILIGGLDFEA
jgi:hypothetical protein